MVLEWVADGGGLCRCLCSVAISYRLDSLAELPIGVGEALVRLLDIHAAQLDAKVRLGEAQSCEDRSAEGSAGRLG